MGIVLEATLYRTVNAEDGLSATIRLVDDGTYRLFCTDDDSGQHVAVINSSNLDLLQEKAAYFLNLW